MVAETLKEILVPKSGRFKKENGAGRYQKLPLPINRLERTELIFASSRGRAWHRSQGPIQEFLCQGHKCEEMAAAILARSNRALAHLNTVKFLYDWEGLRTYSINARIEYGEWVLENRAKIGAMHIYADEPLVCEGISLAGLGPEDAFYVHQVRRTFDEARARALSSFIDSSVGVLGTLDVAEGVLTAPIAVEDEILEARPRTGDFLLSGRTPDSSDLALENEKTLVPGEVVGGRYQIKQQVGEGASSSVFRAHDIALDRKVSIKLIKSFGERDGADDMPKEARALASLRHPNVAGIYHDGSHGGLHYLVTEYVSGGDLGEVLNSHIRRNAQVPFGSGLKILQEVADALWAVHAAGLIHRDLKPENVIVEEGSGRVVLVDFGLARSNEGAKTDQGLLSGTPAYMAPELWSGREYGSAQSDFYAWAVMAYELMTGVLPFPETELGALADAHRRAAVVAPSEHRAELADLDELLLAALAKNPADRPRSVSGIRGVLSDVIERRRVRRHQLDAYTGTLRILLVVADRSRSSLVFRAVQETFGSINTQIVQSSDGDHALTACRRCEFDLIVVDSILPEMHGVDWIARRRKEHPHSSAIEVVLEPSSCDEEWWLRSLGVHRFILAPLALPRLQACFSGLGVNQGWLI